MRSFPGSTALLGLCMLPAAALGAEAPKPPTPQEIEFFEKKVRPILADHCYSCHGPKKQMGGGLRVDSRDGMLKGGDGGSVLTPGKPEQSPMIRAVLHSGDVKMPPKAKLPAEAVEALKTWVSMGAPWPDSTATLPGPGTETIQAAARKHWAFQPVKPVVAPSTGGAWVKNPVDAFVLAKLQPAGLSPAPPADRRTLVRRITYDLIGLPPTPAEIDDALADPSDDWFVRVVERLLASPQYGERWGRHWLDVSRYADTKGYVFLEERKFPFAYTYRDYVVRSFNEDLPYDRFIQEQLAADQLPGVAPRSLAAMGYLTLGRRVLNNTHDIIDDRIDVTTRGLLGLTVSCARCHDHKFDPIPIKDYYSLYGVFANSVEPKDLPLIAEVEQTAAFQAYEKELQAREQQFAAFTQTKYGELLQRLRGQVGDYLLAVRQAEKLPGEDHYEALNPGDLNPDIIRRWQSYLAETRKQHHPVFAAWHAFAALPQKEFKEKAGELARKLAANDNDARKLHPLVAALFADRQPQSLQDVARWYGELFAGVEKQWQETKAKDANLKALADPQREVLRQLVRAANFPANPPVADIEAKRLFDRDTRNQLAALKRKVDEWKANSTAAPPRAMVLNDAPRPNPTRVLLRGNPNSPGDVVPRQFLGILAGEQRKPFAQGSGRLELAQAIAHRDNPLTARVMVNRIWLHHFGQGLVRTPSDFGLRGEPPTHPELLDYLARSFMDNGWSVKQVHRLIVLSNTYQQASQGDSRLATLDAENRLLARQNRRRLDFEQLRDSLLSTAGQLDPRSGGAPADITTQPFTRRRTLYGFIERQNLPGIFRTFDFASPDTSTAQRFTTTVPQQALFLMNSPFTVEQARHFAARTQGLENPEERIAAFYRLSYGRKPDASEIALGLRFVNEAEKEGSQPGKGLAAWEKYAQVLLLSNEFAFVD
ncbi:MAG: PSD1 domain-containing protein [Planctomycetia bacterium]|nr:PSD1 domain-containing protein [Planctomycetia bacterium]